jgi:hypothetical protein
LKKRALLKIFEVHTQKGFEMTFTKHFEIRVRFSKHLKQAKSSKWDKAFQKKYFEGHFYTKRRVHSRKF